MKNLFIPVLLLIATLHLSGQQKKFSFGLEYAPGFSNNTLEFRDGENAGFRLTHNAFIKIGYGLNRQLELTSGIGFMNTRTFERLELNGQLDINFINLQRFHDFAVVPLGIKLNLGSFFINPEVGIAYNFRNPTKQWSGVITGNGEEIIKSHYNDNFNTPVFNKITYPAFLTIGNEFRYHSVLLVTGIKGYYSFSKSNTHPSGHPYGVGIMAGVRF
ncbi:MAG TPA: hypothetical protein VFG10_12655 [Saprospiraceae bacterium]|nr:hypothetical protein [Saprospiraceae bacterium]